jgi:TusA-related sulfurtransferase
VEPTSPDHKLPGMKRITGLDDLYIPKILDNSVIDVREEVSDEAAYRTAIRLARKDGVLVGPTTGAILNVALRYAKSNSGLAVVISPDDAFKYVSFYKDFLDRGYEDMEDIVENEHDLSDFICPLSKMKATELIDNLQENESIRIILGDSESLKTVAQELKTRNLKPAFEQKSETRYILTITK